MAARPSTPRAGFTLVETIAAIVILAVAIPPMFWALRDAQTRRVNPVLASRAQWLALEKMEDVLADRNSPSRGYGWLVPANYPPEASVAGFPAYARSVSFQDTGPDLVTAGTGYRTVTVRVSWTDATGTLRDLDVALVVTSTTP